MPKSVRIDSEIWKYIRDHSYFFKDELIMYQENECTLSGAYKDIEDEVLNLQVLPDDIWVITFPKCGTTWTQEMVWMIANDLDFEAAKVPLDMRFPFLEFPGMDKGTMKTFNVPEDKELLHVKSLKSPRFIKSHLPYGLLPRQLWEVKPKIIYVMREPKDVVESYFNHYSIFNGYSGTKEKFYEAFMANHTLWGSYWGNVLPFWKMQHQPNILINTFEEMKKDLATVIRRTAKFLEKNVPEDQINRLLEHLHFSNMKDNEFINLKTKVDEIRNVHGVAKDKDFFNEGKVGNYKQKMSPEWVRKFDDWKIQEKIKYGLDKDINFPY